MSKIPHILAAVRTYRELRNWSFNKALDHAIDEYRKRGWDIPQSIERLYGKSGLGQPVQDSERK